MPLWVGALHIYFATLEAGKWVVIIYHSSTKTRPTQAQCWGWALITQGECTPPRTPPCAPQLFTQVKGFSPGNFPHPRIFPEKKIFSDILCPTHFMQIYNLSACNIKICKYKYYTSFARQDCLAGYSQRLGLGWSLQMRGLVCPAAVCIGAICMLCGSGCHSVSYDVCIMYILHWITRSKWLCMSEPRGLGKVCVVLLKEMHAVLMTPQGLGFSQAGFSTTYMVLALHLLSVV